MNLETVTGTVVALRLVRTSAIRYSFQAKTKVKMAVTATPGAIDRQDDAAQDGEVAQPVEHRRLVEIARHLDQEAAQQPDGEGEVEGDVDEDQPEIGVDAGRAAARR